eukprot:COSAG01_NODE_2350_length_7855_cov_9.576973_2_plen_572_part_00
MRGVATFRATAAAVSHGLAQCALVACGRGVSRPCVLWNVSRLPAQLQLLNSACLRRGQPAKKQPPPPACALAGPSPTSNLPLAAQLRSGFVTPTLLAPATQSAAARGSAEPALDPPLRRPSKRLRVAGANSGGGGSGASSPEASAPAQGRKSAREEAAAPVAADVGTVAMDVDEPEAPSAAEGVVTAAPADMNSPINDAPCSPEADADKPKPVTDSAPPPPAPRRGRRNKRPTPKAQAIATSSLAQAADVTNSVAAECSSSAAAPGTVAPVPSTSSTGAQAVRARTPPTSIAAGVAVAAPAMLAAALPPPQPQRTQLAQPLPAAGPPCAGLAKKKAGRGRGVAQKAGKRPWTAAEDDTVRQLVKQMGACRWSEIAQHVLGRCVDGLPPPSPLPSYTPGDATPWPLHRSDALAPSVRQGGEAVPRTLAEPPRPRCLQGAVDSRRRAGAAPPAPPHRCALSPPPGPEPASRQGRARGGGARAGRLSVERGDCQLSGAREHGGAVCHVPDLRSVRACAVAQATVGWRSRSTCRAGRTHRSRTDGDSPLSPRASPLSFMSADPSLSASPPALPPL